MSRAQEETGAVTTRRDRDTDGAVVDAAAHLARQRELLQSRIAHLQRMLRAVDTMMEKNLMNENLTAVQRAEIMGDEWDPAWQAEAEERWGDGEDWRVASERLAGRTPEQQRADRGRLEQVEAALAAAKREGVAPGSERANALAEEHRASLTWFDVTPAKHVVLARGYAADPRFAARYEALEPGMAAWLKEVIDAAAAVHGVDPATASWE